MTQSIQALREERTAKAREARNILENKTGKDWTEAVKNQVDGIYADIDRLDEQLQRFERSLTIEDSLEQRGGGLADREGRSIDENAAIVAREKSIFNTWARAGHEGLDDAQRAHVKARRDEAQRIYGAQSVGTGSAGGYLAPRDFSATMLERMALFGGMREVAQVIQTDSGNAIDYPTVDETGSEGEIVGESVAANAGDITFGTLDIGAFKYSSKVVVVPLELLQDSRIDIESYVNVALATRIARVAQTLGEESAAAIDKAMRTRVAEISGQLEQAVAHASGVTRETTVQLREQLAKVDDLVGNLETRLGDARQQAEEQVDNDFARRAAVITESLNSNAIDIASALSSDIADTAWAAYLRGDRGIFTRRAVSLLDAGEARAIQQTFERDDAFRANVSRYIHDFEAILRQVLSTRDGNALGVTLLSSDMGKLYVALAQAIERLRS